MNICYFVWVWERVGLEEEIIDLLEIVRIVVDLIGYFKFMDDNYVFVFVEEDVIWVVFD